MENIFRKYRTKQGEIWQVARQRAPYWTEHQEGEPASQPWMVICLSLRTRRALSFGPQPEVPGVESFLAAVTGAARSWKLRPVHVEVDDAEIATALEPRLAAEKVPVVAREDLPELRARVTEDIERFRRGRPPAALSAPGVTVELLARFARAVVRFDEAAPWRQLVDEDDVVALAAPGLPIDLRFVHLLSPALGPILRFCPDGPWEFNEVPEDFDEAEIWQDEPGEGGDDGREGQGEEAEDREEPREVGGSGPGHGAPHWTLNLCRAVHTPAEDVALWTEQSLPLCGGIYPVAFLQLPAGGYERPGASLLSWMTAILTALAAATEEEMDRGIWTREVAADHGPVLLVLALPDVLRPSWADEPPLRGDPAPGPESRAAELAIDAEETWGRRQIHLARRAVALWPDCIEAWLVLARRALDHATARDRYAAAVAAGERLFPEISGHGSDVPDSEERRSDLLPYLWARTGLALVLWDQGERDEAVDQLRRTSDIAPWSKPTRLLLAHALVAEGRREEARGSSHAEDDSAERHSLHALLAFGSEGDSPAARGHLAAAVRANRNLARHLLDPVPDLPDGLGSFSWNAAEIGLFQSAWASVEGAHEWLREQSTVQAGTANRRLGRRKSGGRRRNRKRRH